VFSFCCDGNCFVLESSSDLVVSVSHDVFVITSLCTRRFVAIEELHLLPLLDSNACATWSVKMRFVFASKVIAITTGINSVEQLDNFTKTVTKSAFTGSPKRLRKLIFPSHNMLGLISSITLR